MTPLPDPSRAVRDAFLAAYRKDLAAGQLRSLVDYQQMFPGKEADVADEWQWLEPSSITQTVTATRTIGPYSILEEIGRGAQATVYRARHETLRRSVALKVLHSSLLLAGDAARARFRREAEATASLEHPGLCSVYEMGQSDGLTWIAMQLVHGETLADHLRQRSASRAPVTLPQDPASDSGGSSSRSELTRAVEFIEKAARALHAAHERGLIHRDIKPGNLMVTEDGQPVVLDFGLARAADGDALALTQTTDTIGTPYYMAPEQLRGADTVDRRVDVWALGVTLYECLAGRRPFDATSREGLYHRILANDPEPLRTQVTGLPRDLEIVLQTALAKEPHHRYQTALAFAEDLRRVSNREPILAREVSVVGRFSRWARRHPAIATSAAIALLSLATGLAVSLQSQARLQAGMISMRAVGLANAARNEIATDPSLGLLLALEGITLAERQETRSALHQAVAAVHELRAFATSGRALHSDALPDGKTFLTGTTTGHIELWNRSGERLWSYRPSGLKEGAEENGVMFLAFLGPRRDRIAAGFRLGAMVVLDLDGKVLHRYQPQPQRKMGYSGFSQFLAQNREHLAISLDGCIQILRLDGDRLTLVQELAKPGIEGAWALHPELRYLAVAGREPEKGQIWKWDDKLHGFQLLGPIVSAPGKIMTLAFSGQRLLSGTIGQHSLCHDLDSGRRITFAGGDQLAWIGTDRVASGYLGGSPRVWKLDGDTFREIARAKAEGLKRTPPRVADDGSMFCAAFQDGPLRCFDRDGKLVATLLGHAGMPQDMMFLPGRTEVFSIGQTARLWSTGDDLVWGTRGGLRYSPNGKWLLAAGYLHDAERRKVRRITELGRHGEWSGSSAPFTSDGAYIGRRGNNSIVVSETATGRVVLRRTLQTSGRWCILPNTTELLLFDVGEWGSQIIDFVSGEVYTGPAVRGFVKALATHGQRIAIGRRPEMVAVYERHGSGAKSTWHLVNERSVADMVRHGEFSPDGRQIAFGTDSGRIHVFDRDLQQPARLLLGHSQRITSVHYSPDGAFLASTSIDETARVWRASGEPWATLRVPSRGFSRCAFRPDGTYLETTDGNGIRSWPLDTHRLIDVARKRKSRDLSPIERKRFAEFLQPR